MTDHYTRSIAITIGPMHKGSIKTKEDVIMGLHGKHQKDVYEIRRM